MDDAVAVRRTRRPCPCGADRPRTRREAVRTRCSRDRRDRCCSTRRSPSDRPGCPGRRCSSTEERDRAVDAEARDPDVVAAVVGRRSEPGTESSSASTWTTVRETASGRRDRQVGVVGGLDSGCAAAAGRGVRASTRADGETVREAATPQEGARSATVRSRAIAGAAEPLARARASRIDGAATRIEGRWEAMPAASRPGRRCTVARSSHQAMGRRNGHGPGPGRRSGPVRPSGRRSGAVRLSRRRRTRRRPLTPPRRWLRAAPPRTLCPMDPGR